MSSCQNVERFLIFSWTKYMTVLFCFFSATCEALLEEECKNLGYNETGFPNILGHTEMILSLKAANEFIWVSKQNCFEYALWFGCTTVYPTCSGGRLLSPCRDFCEGIALSHWLLFSLLHLPALSLAAMQSIALPCSIIGYYDTIYRLAA